MQLSKDSLSGRIGRVSTVFVRILPEAAHAVLEIGGKPSRFDPIEYVFLSNFSGPNRNDFCFIEEWGTKEDNPSILALRALENIGLIVEPQRLYVFDKGGLSGTTEPYWKSFFSLDLFESEAVALSFTAGPDGENFPVLVSPEKLFEIVEKGGIKGPYRYRLQKANLLPRPARFMATAKRSPAA